MRHTTLLLLAMLLPSLATAMQFSATGHGATDAEARSNAQAALAESLYVDIRSEYVSLQNSKGTGETELSISSSTNLPLLGISISVSQKSRGYYAEAMLNSATSLPLYLSTLRELTSTINKRHAQLAKLDRTTQSQVLQELLAAVDQLERLKTVTHLLGGKENFPVATSRDQLVQQLQTIAALAPSVEMAAIKLSQLKNYADIYVYPPHPRGSREITQLSRLLRDAVAANIKHRASDPATSNYFYRGEYEILKSGIYVSYQLMDDTAKVIQTNTAVLAPEAYNNIAFQPQHVNFDQLLHEGYVQDKSFRASLATNRGSEDLLFRQGESVKLYAKLNSPGYFYIVSHTSNNDGNHSYLLELGEGLDKRKFVKYVNADDVNKWLELGEFEVAPPFGIESLQLIAASKDIVNNVPDARWDDKSQLYIVSSDSTDVIRKTRALKLKKDQAGERQLAETVLMLTTSP